jgi:hypothetical protein
MDKPETADDLPHDIPHGQTTRACVRQKWIHIFRPAKVVSQPVPDEDIEAENAQLHVQVMLAAVQQTVGNNIDDIFVASLCFYRRHYSEFVLDVDLSAETCLLVVSTERPENFPRKCLHRQPNVERFKE